MSSTPAPDDREGTRQWLESAIDGLPEVFRTVLVLRLVEDLSGVEVAACLGLHETTVRTRLFRAQQRLKTEVARRLRAEPRQHFRALAGTLRSDRVAGLLATAPSPRRRIPVEATKRRFLTRYGHAGRH